MSKPKPIQINVPNPCSQNWDEMTLSGSGRFCDHCMKTVIDFTTYSDTALYNFFSKNTGHVCGRFLSSQVDRPITLPYQPHSRLYRITVALGLTLLFTQTPHLLAQNRPPKTTQTILPTYSQEQKYSTTTSTKGEINGRVLDPKKEPLPSAVIQVYQNGILKGGNVSDYDGNYAIKSLEPGAYDILVLYAGYDSIKEKSVLVASGAISTRNYQMQSSYKGLREIVRMGGIGKPLIDRDNPGEAVTKPLKLISAEKQNPLPVDPPGTKTFTHEEINNMPH